MKPSFTSITAWLIYLFLVTPTLIVIPMSFSASTELVFPPENWGLDLYRLMLDPTQGWVASALRSLWIAVLTTALGVCLGVPAAYGLARTNFPGDKVLAFLFASPIFAPTIVIALALYLYFAQLGISGTLSALVLGHALVVTPFIIVTTTSGLKHLDRNIEAAAMVMGASTFQIFLKVVLPNLARPVASGALFAFLLSFDEVIVSWFVARGDQPTLPVKMYSSIQWEVSPVLAAISTVLVVGTVILSLLAAGLQPSERKDAS